MAIAAKNRYFDEKMDGIVYAVCVSLGFEALENIFHTIHNQRNSCYKWHPIDCILGTLSQNVKKNKKHLDRDDDRNNQSNCSIL
ncbi:MAG: PrsW family intramembrane metalloprotease [Bacteroidaceae bacterium]|nr:PrsW family intramembrane metalloprotease [Bacteroidaceae bacterium]